MLHPCYMKRSPPSHWSGLHHTHLVGVATCVSIVLCLQRELVQYPSRYDVVTTLLLTLVEFAASSRTQDLQFLASLSSGILATWPYQRGLAALMKVSIGMILARLRTSSLDTWKNHLIFRILRREIWWKTLNLFICSKPQLNYNKTVTTAAL